METSILASKPSHCWYVEGPSLCISSPASGGGEEGRMEGMEGMERRRWLGAHCIHQAGGGGGRRREEEGGGGRRREEEDEEGRRKRKGVEEEDKAK